MGPGQPEIENRKILDLRLPEILAPVTPGVSLGTKKFFSEILLYHENEMLFYWFCGLVMPKIGKSWKNMSSLSISALQ